MQFFRWFIRTHRWSTYTTHNQKNSDAKIISYTQAKQNFRWAMWTVNILRSTIPNHSLHSSIASHSITRICPKTAENKLHAAAADPAVNTRREHYFCIVVSKESAELAARPSAPDLGLCRGTRRAALRRQWRRARHWLKIRFGYRNVPYPCANLHFPLFTALWAPAKVRFHATARLGGVASDTAVYR